MKKCGKCKIIKEYAEYNKKTASKDGYRGNCKKCQALYRLEHKKTFKGKISKTYQDLRNRCKSKYFKNTKYYGLDYCTKDEFYKFSLNDTNYLNLYNKWKETNFQNRKTMPSIDRINNDKGYTTCNIQWVTYEDNLKKGNRKLKTIK